MADFLLAPILMSFVSSAPMAYLSDSLADRLKALWLKRQNAVIVVFRGHRFSDWDCAAADHPVAGGADQPVYR
ncbi:hypothetical protein [Methylocaldum szegediense]|uniref:hypothetical protein n=1 Tax=Methylocaldum szegediense TaxID=73780 RepID=UPI00192E4394|nr:hypothetical protein [Methylocaldum szegediense]